MGQLGRLHLSLSVLLLMGTAGPLAAQVEIGPAFGFHFDRSNRVERRIIYSITPNHEDAWQVNAPKNVVSVGGRIGVGIVPRIRFEAQVLYSRNTAWTFIRVNTTIPASTIPADSAFAFTKLFVLSRLLIDLLPANRALAVRVGAGPGIVTRSGSGEDLLVHSTTVAGNVGVQAVRFLGPLGVGVDAAVLLYTGHLAPQFPYQEAAQGPQLHTDFSLSWSLVYRFGRPPRAGVSSGSGFTPPSTP